MAIAVDSITSNDTTSFPSTSVTISHTVAGSDRLLVVGASMWQTVYNTGNVTGITYNGDALTLGPDVTVQALTYGLRSQIWYLVAPDTGTNNLVLTITGTTELLALRTGTLSLTGASQSSPLDTSATNTGTSNTLSSSVTTGFNGEYIVDCVANFSGNDITKDATQTVISDFTSVGTSGGSSYFAQTSAGAKTMQWTSPGSDQWSSVSASFKEAGAAPTTNSGLLTMF